ncbi:MAG: acyltransferase [Gammaproteobacteria bacterium]|nr:acyltransferase [Gammaproteobacteria bacterium]MDH5728613.1 acyltransferase [Gammaproteobacteria bacterium]
MQYRREIDGLRAIAVLPVILFHAGFEIFSGGYIGVDVFFVISGYLITTIILQEQDSGKFSIARFYDRRARRILPALFVVMIVCIPFAWTLMLPSQFKAFSESLVAVIIFVSNILFWQQSGYFAAAAEEKPLLHTWSLAVEEQYYVFFPIFILLFWRMGKSNLMYLIIVITAISFSLAEYASRFHPNANFFITPTRAWELLVGSLAAFILFKKTIKPNSIFSSLGVLLIIISIFVYDDGAPWPSMYSLAPVLGTMLIILYTGKNSLAYKMLSMRFFVGIGLISYSAYLWHQPLFAFARIQSVGEPSQFLMGTLAFVSLVLAYFTWRFVEKPFRNREKMSLKALTLYTAPTAAIIVAIGFFGVSTKGKEDMWLSSVSDETKMTYALLKEPRDNPRHLNECNFRVRSITTKIEQQLAECKKQKGQGIAILGDSHAIDLYGAISSNLNKNDFVIGISIGGCRPHTPEDNCHYDSFRQALVKGKYFHTVIYEQAGFYLLMDEVNNIQNSRLIFDRYNYEESVPDLTPHSSHISRVSEYLLSLSEHTKLIWLGPRIEHHIPKRVMLRLGCSYQYHLRDGTRTAFETLDNSIRDRLSDERYNKITYVSQLDAYSFEPETDILTCETSFWNDGDHWNRVGEKKFGALIVKHLKENTLLKK